MTERLHPKAERRQPFEESLHSSGLEESPRDKHGDPADPLRPSTMSSDGGWPPFGTIVPDQFKLAAKGVKGTIADSLSSVVFSSASLQGLSEEVMGVAMSKGLDAAIVGAPVLQGLSDEAMGAAMRKGLDASNLLGEMTAGIDSAVRAAADLQGLRETLMKVALPFDFGRLSPVRDMATSVNSAVIRVNDFRAIQEELQGVNDRWRRYAKSMLENAKAFTDRYLESQERFRACCMELGQRGWFLDPQMPMSFLWNLGDIIVERPEVADGLLSQWFQERLDEIEEELVKTCSKRAQLLRSAFNAHREKDYNNSIPAFLKEADGMWHDIFGVNVFVAGARKSIAKMLEEKRPYGLVGSSLVPLLQSTLPLWMNEIERHNWMKKQRIDAFPGLNRHEVLHGISVDYGTEINSLKAISFLNWRLLVGCVL